MTKNRRINMAMGRPLWGSLALTLFAFLLVTWPLPRHMGSGIPSSHRPEPGGARMMIAGDHLQLMYFFQLMTDFIAGHTPWFYNLYELNQGDDEARYERDYYYAPFSLVFAAVAASGNLALSWNLTGFFCMWATAFGTWLLVRRFTRDIWIVLTATAVGLLIPYRLIAFMQGSPTGFAMTYVPFILLGLDVAIRDGRPSGGATAGLCFMLSGWGDIHTFFFSALLIPCWSLFVFLYQDFRLNRARFMKIFRALLPFLAFVVLVGVHALVVRNRLQKTDMAEGRMMHEVMIFSPAAEGLLGLNPDGPHSLIYITYSLLAMVLLGIVVWGVRLFRRPSRSLCIHAALYACLLAGCGVILLLALGPRMAASGPVWWNRLCRVIPPYGMIRQPPKIFAVLPPLAAVLVALPFAGWHPMRRGLLATISSVLLLSLVAEAAWRIEPAICLLDTEQGAYAAVVDNARLRGEKARAVAVVLWPGDTHWSSLYEYYGKMYRIRMLNVYRPHVPQGYVDDVFFRYMGLNRGYAPDDLLDSLLAKGINHVLLHEDAFPERVSDFAVAWTLAAFLEHPRLRLLEQDRSVWAFEIVENPREEHVVQTDWQVASPVYCWDAEHLATSGAAEVVGNQPDSHNGHYVTLSAPDGRLQLPAWGLHFRDTLRVAIRLRGKGTLQATFSLDEEGGKHTLEQTLDADQWSWLDVPFPAFDGFSLAPDINLQVTEGRLDIDYLFIALGESPAHLKPGEAFRIPAPTLFRAGFTRLERDTVMLTPEAVPADHVVYGPRLPLPAGEYLFRLHYRPGDYAGVVGTVGFRYPGKADNPARTEVIGDQAMTVVPYIQQHNVPVTFDFKYNRRAPLELSALEIYRVR